MAHASKEDQDQDQLEMQGIATSRQPHQELDPGKPSNVFHGDKYVVRIYTDESNDPHVYVRVKHVWFKNKGNNMCILHYYPDGSYRYVIWKFAQVIWYQITPERFDQQNLENETKIDR